MIIKPFSLISSLMASINGFRTLLNRTGPSQEAMSNILTESSKYGANLIIFLNLRFKCIFTICFHIEVMFDFWRFCSLQRRRRGFGANRNVIYICSIMRFLIENCQESENINSTFFLLYLMCQWIGSHLCQLRLIKELMPIQ